jgi:hypothetical protein
MSNTEGKGRPTRSPKGEGCVLMHPVARRPLQPYVSLPRSDGTLPLSHLFRPIKDNVRPERSSRGSLTTSSKSNSSNTTGPRTPIPPLTQFTRDTHVLFKPMAIRAPAAVLRSGNSIEKSSKLSTTNENTTTLTWEAGELTSAPSLPEPVAQPVTDLKSPTDTGKVPGLELPVVLQLVCDNQAPAGPQPDDDPPLLELQAGIADTLSLSTTPPPSRNLRSTSSDGSKTLSVASFILIGVAVFFFLFLFVFCVFKFTRSRPKPLPRAVPVGLSGVTKDQLSRQRWISQIPVAKIKVTAQGVLNLGFYFHFIFQVQSSVYRYRSGGRVYCPFESGNQH